MSATVPIDKAQAAIPAQRAGDRAPPGRLASTAERDRTTASLCLCGILTLYFALIAFLPLASAVKIGADEDFELSKATLCLKGYHLYTEVWNDHPPLSTFIITQILHFITPSPAGPRMLTVLFSAGMLAAFFLMVRRVNGLLAATIGTLMLMGSPGFLELASSCMLENLGLAPVVISLCILVWRGSSIQGVIAAGIAFGVALQMKVIGAMYLPLIGLMILLSRPGETPGGNERRSWFISALKQSIVPSCVFGAVLIATFCALNALTGNPLLLQLKQSLSSHFASTRSFEYGSPADRPFNWLVLARNWDAVIPAAIGAVLILISLAKCVKPTGSSHSAIQPSSNPFIHQSSQWLLLPLSWLALTFVIFPLHRPWWAYYYVHTSVPLCWCAGIGLAAAGSWAIRKTTLTLPSSRRPKALECGSPLPLPPAVLRTKRQRTDALQDAAASPAWTLVLALCSLVVAGWMATRVFLEIRDIRSGQRIDSCMVLKEINRYKPYTKFLFAFDPIYSFHSGIPMPSDLAVIPLKRMWTGEMTNARLAAELEEMKPGLIVLANNGEVVPYQPLIEREYKLVYRDERNRLFAHRSISKKPYGIK